MVQVQALMLPHDKDEYLRLRMHLYEGDSETEVRQDMQRFLNKDTPHAVFVAKRPSSKLAGFVEVGTREYAEGCSTAPVAYLEGWYVDADVRREGIGRLLVAAAEAWARRHGYTELASDALLANAVSQAAHRAVGFREVERQVCFIKKV